MQVKFCPKCESEQVELVIGGKMGLWECRKCGFRSALFPEKNLPLQKVAKDKGLKSNNKSKTKKSNKK